MYELEFNAPQIFQEMDRPDIAELDLCAEDWINRHPRGAKTATEIWKNLAHKVKKAHKQLIKSEKHSHEAYNRAVTLVKRVDDLIYNIGTMIGEKRSKEDTEMLKKVLAFQVKCLEFRNNLMHRP